MKGLTRLHRDRRWPRADNHMDARHCPDCGVTVHGNRGQYAHRIWHLQLADLLESLIERTGAAPSPGVPWTAVVDSSADDVIELEASQ